MRVEIVYDKSPSCIRVGRHDSIDVFEEVFLRSRFTKHGGDNCAGRNMKIAEQTNRSVANVLVLTARWRARLWTQVRSDSL